MNDVDRKIPERLAADEADLLGPLGEPSLWKQVIEMFGGKLRWLNVVVAVGSLACGVFAVVSAVYFFQAESLHGMIAWAAGFGFGLISVTGGRIGSGCCFTGMRLRARSNAWSCKLPGCRTG